VAAQASLPQLDGRTFITDGGMETTLIFRDGLELPEFASFVLLDDPEGLAALRGYYASYVAIAERHGVGIVLDTPTWRANPDWGVRLGYSADALGDVNRRGVTLLEEVRAEAGDVEMLISGCIGPRGDRYVVGDAMRPDEAQAYHSAQISTFAGTEADLVSALTLNYADEATGIAQAAAEAGIPSVISFTVETDGRLPSGQELRDAVAEVDAATDGAPAYYMVNCAHPTHFENVLAEGGLERVRGLRANASMKSHAELDEAEDLDQGDPDDLAERYRAIRPLMPGLNVVGGCCGTDERHIEAICSAFAG
jgi:S-methylmethionine-dependent homocysteine/selenocysteine methylase